MAAQPFFGKLTGMPVQTYWPFSMPEENRPLIISVSVYHFFAVTSTCPKAYKIHPAATQKDYPDIFLKSKAQNHRAQLGFSGSIYM